jgi:predicted metalloprotease with PDZ domain
MQILCTIRATEPAEHRGRFSIELEGVEAPSIDFVLPSWVPGSYHIVNYARGFRGFQARRASDGAPLAVERIDKGRWRVATKGATAFRVDYTVYGHEALDESFDLTADHMLVNAALCIPYVDGHLPEPIEIAIEAPVDWKIVTELEEIGGRPPRYRARNYDDLVDNPIDLGHPLVLTIRPAGIPHRICLCGEGANYEAHRLEEDLGKMVEATVRLVGESPLPGYTFFYHLTGKPDGGLEHARSTVCVLSRTIFRPAEAYRHFLSVSSHEYFHLYNVKRIRPKVLGPFDYTREVYTRLLWWMEGTTDYFSDLVLRRAGLLTPAKYLDGLAHQVQDLLETPGRRHQSLEEASFLAWIDYYQPFEETPNQSVSYYIKGHVVSCCLDLEIRHRTENRLSLDSVLRALWNDYGRIDRGLEEGELFEMAEKATGLDLGPFWQKYIRGTDEIAVDAFARFAGLTFGPKPRDPDADTDTPGYLGIRFEDAGGLPQIRHVLADTPARRAGLSPGDEIVAVNRTRVGFLGFEKVMQRAPPGTPLELTLFRRGYLKTVSLTTGQPPPEKYRFTPQDDPGELERRIYESWLETKWEGKKEGTTPAPA